MFSLYLKPTSLNRGWFVPPFGGNPWWVYLAAAIPALLVTILIFMDQQITAVIVNRKEHKLKVNLHNNGYHCLLLSFLVLENIKCFKIKVVLWELQLMFFKDFAES